MLGGMEGVTKMDVRSRRWSRRGNSSARGNGEVRRRERGKAALRRTVSKVPHDDSASSKGSLGIEELVRWRPGGGPRPCRTA